MAGQGTRVHELDRRRAGPAEAPAERRARLEDWGKLVLRLTVAGLLLFHGADKLVHGPGPSATLLAERGLPGVLALGVYLTEVVAPLLVVLGLWTRPAALLCAGGVLFASAVVNGQDYVSLAPTGAWAAESFVFYVLGGLAVALLGAGRLAVRGGRGRLD